MRESFSAASRRIRGGDRLAAAIAAGETPSPEMVAASGSTEGLKPWIAWACLAFIILGIGAAVLLGRQFQLFQLVRVENPPDVMVKTARDILKNLGYSDPPVDSTFGFVANQDYLQNVAKNDRSPMRFAKLPAIAVQFWHRQSPKPLVHLNPKGYVTATNPPPIAGGESVVWLDSQGRLTALRVIPSSEGKPSGVPRSPDWSVLFNAAGFDPAKCTPQNRTGHIWHTRTPAQPGREPCRITPTCPFVLKRLRGKIGLFIGAWCHRYGKARQLLHPSHWLRELQWQRLF